MFHKPPDRFEDGNLEHCLQALSSYSLDRSSRCTRATLVTSGARRWLPGWPWEIARPCLGISYRRVIRSWARRCSASNIHSWFRSTMR